MRTEDVFDDVAAGLDPTLLRCDRPYFSRIVYQAVRKMMKAHGDSKRNGRRRMAARRAQRELKRGAR